MRAVFRMLRQSMIAVSLVKMLHQSHRDHGNPPPTPSTGERMLTVLNLRRAETQPASSVTATVRAGCGAVLATSGSGQPQALATGDLP
jgi:hypothetical protein